MGAFDKSMATRLLRNYARSIAGTGVYRVRGVGHSISLAGRSAGKRIITVQFCASDMGDRPKYRFVRDSRYRNRFILVVSRDGEEGQFATPENVLSNMDRAFVELAGRCRRIYSGRLVVDPELKDVVVVYRRMFKTESDLVKKAEAISMSLPDNVSADQMRDLYDRISRYAYSPSSQTVFKNGSVYVSPAETKRAKEIYLRNAQSESSSYASEASSGSSGGVQSAGTFVETALSRSLRSGVPSSSVVSVEDVEPDGGSDQQNQQKTGNSMLVAVGVAAAGLLALFAMKS